MRDSYAVPMAAQVMSRDRSFPHVGRKFYHFVMGLFCFAMYAFVLDRDGAVLTLGIVGGVWVTLDVLRLRSPKLNDLALKYFGNLMRREELKGVSANSFYIIGLFLVTCLFPKPIVLLSVLFLAAGDPAAAIVGTAYGRRKMANGKSLEGSAACFAACAVASLICSLAYFQVPADKGLLFALVGGTIGTIAEALPVPVNDNFAIPTISAMLLGLASQILPLF